MIETTLLSSSPSLQYSCLSYTENHRLYCIEVCVAVVAKTVKDLGRF